MNYQNIITVAVMLVMGGLLFLFVRIITRKAKKQELASLESPKKPMFTKPEEGKKAIAQAGWGFLIYGTISSVILLLLSKKYEVPMANYYFISLVMLAAIVLLLIKNTTIKVACGSILALACVTNMLVKIIEAEGLFKAGMLGISIQLAMAALALRAVFAARYLATGVSPMIAVKK